MSLVAKVLKTFKTLATCLSEHSSQELRTWDKK